MRSYNPKLDKLISNLSCYAHYFSWYKFYKFQIYEKNQEWKSSKEIRL